MADNPYQHWIDYYKGELAKIPASIADSPYRDYLVEQIRRLERKGESGR